MGSDRGRHPAPTEKQLRKAWSVYAEEGYVASQAARRLGMPERTFRYWVARCARDLGLTRPEEMVPEVAPVPRTTEDVRAKAVKALRAPGGHTIDSLAAVLCVTRGQVLDLIDAMRTSGMNLHEIDGRLSIEREPAPQHALGDLPSYTSRKDNTFVFGFTSDNHIGSKYARLDVLNDLYDRFAAEGVDRVFNAGNYIDGEARFNKHELLVHGMDRQLAYLAKAYPQRKGIITYAVAGDDHEGWYCQREGVDIGAYAEMKMRQAGREDFVNLGYMEAFVRLVNANTKHETKLLVCHPGGGSAYAISYTSQKSVEAFEGGEKPAVALFGHYHKMAYNLIRNVHAIQTGCTQDQTSFMRKKKLMAHIGGGICRLTQDPETGAIIACRVEFFNYFNTGYYNGRWSMSEDAALPERRAQ